MTDREALPIMTEIVGDVHRCGCWNFLETLLAVWCGAGEQVDNLFSVDSCITVGAYSDGGGVVCGCLVLACACWTGYLVAVSLDLGSAACCVVFLDVLCAAL